VRWPRWARRRDHTTVDEALERVGMCAYRRAPIGRLSSGQQQRVFLARALVQAADVLLLDEPMTGIDVAAQGVILSVIDAQRAAGKIVLMATHDLTSASCACDCLCCLNGSMVQFGSVEDTYTADILAATYGARVLSLDPSGPPKPARRLGRARHPAWDAPDAPR
jgi:manganese/zinc/iron transport system ATP- binding protein